MGIRIEDLVAAVALVVADPFFTWGMIYMTIASIIFGLGCLAFITGDVERLLDYFAL